MNVRLYDAHNHLQDDRLQNPAEIMAACRSAGVTAMVVNGACEQDWFAVAALARDFPEVIPSFGYHPWYLHERTADWLGVLRRQLEEMPSAVGEIGLDRWKPELSYEGQEEAFVAQLELAAEMNLPVSIHCLQAWGRLFDLLRAKKRPACGFLLHSYGGPKEMVPSFVTLGAYFSFPGYFAQERKQRQRETFRHIPLDRLLVETDAPDQLLPEERTTHPLRDSTGKAINHPANLAAVYEALAEVLGQSREKLAGTVAGNFERLFGAIKKL